MGPSSGCVVDEMQRIFACPDSALGGTDKGKYSAYFSSPKTIDFFRGQAILIFVLEIEIP